MKQVFFIHGGTSAFDTYEQFIDYLKGMKVDLANANKRAWPQLLQESLGPDYEVFWLRMPNRENAKYEEWRIWFSKYVPLIQNGAVLIGHSLGAIFLAKYLATEDVPVTIAGTFLVAAPHTSGGSGEYSRDMGQFTPPDNLEKFAQQGGAIFLYHSKDDPVVSFAELAKYQAALPSATVRIFEDRGHFYGQESFPELVADIKALP